MLSRASTYINSHIHEKRYTNIHRYAHEYNSSQIIYTFVQVCVCRELANMRWWIAYIYDIIFRNVCHLLCGDIQLRFTRAQIHIRAAIRTKKSCTIVIRKSRKRILLNKMVSMNKINSYLFLWIFFQYDDMYPATLALLADSQPS